MWLNELNIYDEQVKYYGKTSTLVSQYLLLWYTLLSAYTFLSFFFLTIILYSVFFVENCTIYKRNSVYPVYLLRCACRYSQMQSIVNYYVVRILHLLCLKVFPLKHLCLISNLMFMNYAVNWFITRLLPLTRRVPSSRHQLNPNKTHSSSSFGYPSEE